MTGPPRRRRGGPVLLLWLFLLHDLKKVLHPAVQSGDDLGEVINIIAKRVIFIISIYDLILDTRHFCQSITANLVFIQILGQF